ncbi:MAG: nitrile hydratase accessory protein [Myxococcota bacterium]|nr:nitrile hydratase accessory protein [Myxococcota bacterium]
MTLDREGPAAPPRSNGELLFAAPWESRAFGMVMALHEQGVFAWDEFRRHLIAEIADWEREHPDGEGYVYYARWLAAFERLLAEKGLCAAGALAGRTRALAERPHGHDHGGGRAQSR